MPEFLFINGPLHGQRRNVDLFTEVVQSPFNWLEALDISMFGHDLCIREDGQSVIVTYRKTKLGYRTKDGRLIQRWVFYADTAIPLPG